jgi:hypothetical protein
VSSGMLRFVSWYKVTDVSKAHSACIFRVKQTMGCLNLASARVSHVYSIVSVSTGSLLQDSDILDSPSADTSGPSSGLLDILNGSVLL